MSSTPLCRIRWHSRNMAIGIYTIGYTGGHNSYRPVDSLMRQCLPPGSGIESDLTVGPKMTLTVDFRI